MKSLIRLFSLAMIMALSLMLFAPAAAQDRGGEGKDRASERQGDRRGGGRDRRQRWENMSEEEREEARKRMAERRAEYAKQRGEELRRWLEISEDDFEVIGPMIDRVRGLLRERQMASGSRGRGGVSRGGGDGVSEQAKSASEAAAQLRQAIEDDNKAGIKDALAKLRKARAAMDAKIKEAREELRGVLTPKWEAGMVVMGVLD